MRSLLQTTNRRRAGGRKTSRK